MTRRGFLVQTAALPIGTIVTAGLYARWVEPVSVRLRREPCRIAGLKVQRPVRVAHLSDLHASDESPKSIIESAVEMTLAEKPDLVCLTGDYVTESIRFDPAWYQRTLRRLSERVPVFATMGNHDGPPGGRFSDSQLMRKLIASSGARVLHNETERFQAAGAEFDLTGLGDLWSRELDPAKAFAGTEAATPRLVLSHNPDSKDRLRDYRWDLMLSGHTHGGQIVLPGLGSPWVPVKDRRYVHGLKPWEDRQIHVTSGVGNLRGVRFNCPPEVVVLELEGTSAGPQKPVAT